jgi:glycerol-3-phosphate dehydrogenase (NAD(P)+)
MPVTPMNAQALHHRARTSGVNPVLYRLVRAVLVPFFRIYFRMERHGVEHVPTDGPLLLAANHRSFLDPFIIGAALRRPVYYIAKKELFANRFIAWLLNALGAFPVDRGASDKEMVETARCILRRGDAVVIFPEGTRIRHGGLATPKRGVGRLALQTGAPVAPIAVVGTEHVRKGWRVRPRRVKLRAGRPLTFPTVAEPSRELAQAVTDRIWPCVALQWEWLGGLAPLRRATVIGAGAWGTALAVALDRAGLEVQLGARTRDDAERLAAERENARYLPGVPLAGVRVARASDLRLDDADVVFLAVPSRSLPHALAAHGERIPASAGLVVLSKGLVGPLGTLPSAFAAERVPARAVACLGGPGHAADCIARGAALVVGCRDRSFAAQLVKALTDAGLSAQSTTDVTGVELAGVAKNAAALAAAAAAHAGPNAAGAAAGRVFAEVEAHARRAGARPETFSGLAGAGDLVATVVAQQSRNRRAGELLAAGVPPDEIGATVGQAVEGLDTLPLLADRLADEPGDHGAVTGLARVVTGDVAPDAWLDGLTSPRRRTRAAA